jgi:hypothetical protein
MSGEGWRGSSARSETSSLTQGPGDELDLP